MSDFSQKDIYKRYLEDGVNKFNTKELLELTDILFGLKKYSELIDVAEYTISLIDMGISNDFVDEDFELGMLNLEEALTLDYEGVQEFIDFDPNFILNNEDIVDLINRYKNN